MFSVPWISWITFVNIWTRCISKGFIHGTNGQTGTTSTAVSWAHLNHTIFRHVTLYSMFGIFMAEWRHQAPCGCERGFIKIKDKQFHDFQSILTCIFVFFFQAKSEFSLINNFAQSRTEKILSAIIFCREPLFQNKSVDNKWEILEEF